MDDENVIDLEKVVERREMERREEARRRLLQELEEFGS